MTKSNSKADIQVSTKGNLQNIGVAKGGNLSITAGSLEAAVVNVTNSGSKANIHVSRDGNLQDIDVTDEGNLSITAGSLDAGHLLVTNSNSEADIHITGDKGLHLSRPIFASAKAKINIDSPLIRVDGDKTSGLYAMNTTDSTISLGNDSSQIVMNGKLLNASSDVTIKGQNICINAPEFLDPDLGSDIDAGSGDNFLIKNIAIKTVGGYKSITNIGDVNTEKVQINGRIYPSSLSSLFVNGKDITFSNAKGIALIGSDHEHDNPSKGTGLLAGIKETENLTVQGQVANIGAAEMKLAGQHITIDSTGYDGSENRGQYPESLLALSNDIHAGTKDTQTISISSGLNALGGNIQVLGKDITVGTSGYFQTHKVEVWDEVNKKYVVLTDNIAHAADGNVTIGSDDTDTVHLYGGQLLADGTKKNNIHGYITIQGHDIS